MLEDTLRAYVLGHKGKGAIALSGIRLQQQLSDEYTEGTVAYRLALPPSMSGVHEVSHVSMLRKYTPDPAHVVDWGQIEVDTDGTFEEEPVCILDSRDQVMRRKTVRLVRVLWQHYGVEESTWERENTMRATYPFLFRDEGTWFSRLRLNDCLHAW